MDANTTQLKALVQLAVIDEKFDKSEEMHIMAIGKANKVPQAEIEKIIQDGLRQKANQEKLDFSSLTFEQKFEYLYNIVQLMKIDHEVFLSEIRFCEGMAERLGFDKKVISQLSKGIYGDPSITSNREKLKEQVKKYFL